MKSNNYKQLEANKNKWNKTSLLTHDQEKSFFQVL